MQLVLDQSYSVTVVKTVPAGIVVKLNDGSTELIHLSNVSTKFVKDPLDYVSIGDKYDAKCIVGFNGKLQLSLKHLELTRHTSRMVVEPKHEAAPTPPQRPVTRSPKHEHRKPAQSLDEMIARSTQSFQDKMAGRKKKDSRRRK